MAEQQIENKPAQEVVTNRYWLPEGSLKPTPIVDEETWQGWMALHKPRLSVRIRLATGLTAGFRFAGVELGINSKGQPLVWQQVLFRDGIAVMNGKLPTVEMLDWHTQRGMLQQVLRTHLKLGWLARIRLAIGYIKWRRQLGGKWPGIWAVIWPSVEYSPDFQAKALRAAKEAESWSSEP
jgi:hypothetical protein